MFLEHEFNDKLFLAVHQLSSSSMITMHKAGSGDDELDLVYRTSPLPTTTTTLPAHQPIHPPTCLPT
jgi:hypothetical protein